MEIIVEGNATKFYKPDEIILNLNFNVKSDLYNEVLEKGTKNVLDFIEKILLKYGFSENDLKTRSFIIKEDKKYNEETRSYEFDGYSFNQNAKLKFGYELEKLTNMMEDISKLDNPPSYQINFGIKDESKIKRELSAAVYKNAEEKASLIALAAGKILKHCNKVSFKPLQIDFLSLSNLNSETMYLRESSMNSLDKTFTPEDIEVSETLYYLWIAE